MDETPDLQAASNPTDSLADVIAALALASTEGAVVSNVLAQRQSGLAGD